MTTPSETALSAELLRFEAGGVMQRLSEYATNPDDPLHADIHELLVAYRAARSQPATEGLREAIVEWAAAEDEITANQSPSRADDDDRLADLLQMSDLATPGPWIRKWESLDVHHMGVGGGGPYALRSMEDIDFAVACVRFVREMLSEREDILDGEGSDG